MSATMSETQIKKPLNIKGLVNLGGEGGIRTHGTGNRTPDFESGTFDHSATSPVNLVDFTALRQQSKRL